LLRLVKSLKWRLLEVPELATLRVEGPDARWEP
jgi:hypothetical protein